MRSPRGRLLVAGILLYVAFDLSCPSLPGAFESLDVGRAGAMPMMTALPPAPIADLEPRASTSLAADRHPESLDPGRARDRCTGIVQLPRGACTTPASSDDPH